MFKLRQVLSSDWLVSVLAVVLALTFVGYRWSHGRASTSAGTNPLVLSDRMYDFGWVPDNVKVHHDFTLTNTSKFRVDVSDILRSCACTAAGVDASHLAAGQSTVLRVEISTAWRDAFTVDLTVPWRYTGASEEHQVNLTVVGRIARDLLIIPPKLDFGSLGQDAGLQTREILLKKPAQAEVEPWTDLKVCNENSDLQSTIKRESDREWKLVVSFDPRGLPIGRRTSTLSLQCMDGEKARKVYTVYVDADVTSDVEASPRSVYLGCIAPLADVTKSVLFRKAAGSFKIISVDSDDQNFVTANWTQEGSGDTRLNLEFTPRGTRGKKVGRLLVQLEADQRLNRLVLPYFGYVQ